MPIIKELLWAEAGKGAFLNNKKVKVSDYNDLSKSYLHYGRPTYFTEHLNGLLKLIGACNGARGLGDLYSYHLLASGRIDINIDGRIAPWDVAPFSVIVKEAGGRITDFEGKDWSINDSRALASNGLVHEKVLKLLTTSNDDR